MARTVRNVVLVALVALLSGACGNDGDGGGDVASLQQLVVDDGPDGFRLEDASGSLDVDDAAVSVGVARAAIQRQLERTGFQGAYARAWSKGDAFAVVAVYDFLNAERAAELVTSVSAEYDSLQAAHLFDLPELDATGVVVNSRSGEETLFCQLVLFSREARAFLVRTCDSSPAPTTAVIELAEREQDFVDIAEK